MLKLTLINKSKNPLSSLVLIGVYGLITMLSSSPILAPAKIQAHVLKPNPLLLSGRPKRATKDVDETGMFSKSGTAVNLSLNWHSPGGTIDLIGGEVNVDGRLDFLALDASGEALEQNMLMKKGKAIGLMRRRTLYDRSIICLPGLLEL